MWYLIRSKPREEKRAVLHLENQHFFVYCPFITKKNGKEEPLFPGYLFLEANNELNQLFSKVSSTRGVTGFVRFGEQFAKVPYDLVEQIKAQEESLSGQPIFKQNQLVTFKEGPFKDLRAVYVCDSGMERCIVLLNILNRTQKIVVEQKEITTY